MRPREGHAEFLAYFQGEVVFVFGLCRKESLTQLVNVHLPRPFFQLLVGQEAGEAHVERVLVEGEALVRVRLPLPSLKAAVLERERQIEGLEVEVDAPLFCRERLPARLVPVIGDDDA